MFGLGAIGEGLVWVWEHLIKREGRASEELTEVIKQMRLELDDCRVKHNASEDDRRRLYDEVARLRLQIVEAITGHVVVRSDGSIIDVNEATTTFVGWRREELVNQSVAMLIPFRFRAKHAKDLETAKITVKGGGLLRPGFPGCMGIAKRRCRNSCLGPAFRLAG